jgi:cell wall-associated NlpC family hydrolase
LRTPPHGRTCARAIAIAVAVLAALAAPASAAGDTGGAGDLPPPPAPGPTGGVPPTTPLLVAELSPDGRTAIAPETAPEEVKSAISAANELTRKPYRYGGGHTSSFADSAYDCSGSVSYALHGAGLLAKPLDSGAFMRWGLRGKGAWITVYTNPGHAFAVIAGLRFDTAGPGQRGPRWRTGARIYRGFTARHPRDL